MKRGLLFCVLVFLMGARVAVNAQEPTLSDVQNSGCLNKVNGKMAMVDEPIPTIILTKEGNVLSVQLLNYEANCATEGFNVTHSISGGSDGAPYSVSVSVEPYIGEDYADCYCPYNVSFTIRDWKVSSFQFSCWWYTGQVNLTEGEPLVLEYKIENVVIDGMYFKLLKVMHKAMLMSWESGKGELRIPSEVSYEGETYSVTSISSSSFEGNITKITVPNTIRSMDFDNDNIIYSNPFVLCKSLEWIEVEEGCPLFSSVEGVLFNKDKTMLIGYPAASPRESYTVPEGVTSVRSGAFSYNQHLQKLTIPDAVQSFGYAAFFECKSLEEVKLPLGLNVIQMYLFKNCQSLRSVDIPKSVTVIVDCAFEGCRGLKDVYCYADSVPRTENGAFYNSSIASATLHVPAGSIEKYKTTTPWSNFRNIVALTTTPVQYFPEGTRWIEIRLDTVKYDSWYSRVGDEWVPNFETVEYYVKGEYKDKYWDNPFKCVYTNGIEWTDSLSLMLWEGKFNGESQCVLATVPPNSSNDADTYVLWPGNAYQFDWSIGMMLIFEDIMSANCSCIFPPDKFDYGVIEDIKEGDFGGVRPLKYADVNGVRIIQGIGVAEWNDGECLFGPVKPYEAIASSYGYAIDARNYRSMLVYFERDGEVLYNVWPERETVSFTQGQMATIILPTTPDASKGRYYRLDRCEKDKIIFEEELQPKARTPYIIVPNEDFSIDLSSLDLEGLRSDTVSTEDVFLIGSYLRRELDSQEGRYIDIIDVTSDCRVAGNSMEKPIIGALRAYLTWDDPYNQGGTKGVTENREIVLHNNETSIGETMVDRKWSDCRLFDLQGRRLSRKPERGVYIENGRKKVVRW